MTVIRCLLAAGMIGLCACASRVPVDTSSSEAVPAQDPAVASATPPAAASADALDRAVLAALARDASHLGLDARAGARGLAAADAGRLADPELRLGTDILHESWDDDGYRASVRWRPPQPGEAQAARAYADARTGRARAEAGLRAMEVEAAVHEAWLAVWTAQRRLAIARRLMELERERSAVLERLIGVGARTAIDRAAAQVRGAESAARHQRLEREHRLALGRLEDLTGLAGVVVEEPVLPADDAIAGLLTPELDEAMAAEQEALAEARQAGLARRPWLNFVEAGTDLDATGSYQGTMVRVGVAVPLPGADGTQRAAASSAEAQRRRQDVARQRREADLARARGACREAREAAADLHRRIAVLGQEVERLGRAIAAQAGDPLAPVELREQLLRLESEAAEWDGATCAAGLALRRLLAPVAGRWR